MRQRDDWHLTADIEHELGRGDPFAAAIRATRMPMCITDPRQHDNPIVFVNEAFQKLTGYGREEIVGRNCRFLQGEQTDRESVRGIGMALAAREPINVELLNYRKDGTTFWNALFISPVRADDGEVQFFFASQLDVTERIEAQKAIAEQKARVEEEVRARTADLEAALEAKTLLLHEVDHRVKNNLTMIGSLLRLQSRAIGDDGVRAVFETLLERVDALAAVHRRLYQSDDIGQFDLSDFVANLASDVVGATGRQDIELALDLAPVTISSRDATAAGMIVNELVLDAIRHGFADRGGILSVAVSDAGDQAVVTIRGGGPGDAEGADTGSIGRTLVERLTGQIGASVDWRSGGDGVEIVLRMVRR